MQLIHSVMSQRFAPMASCSVADIVASLRASAGALHCNLLAPCVWQCLSRVLSKCSVEAKIVGHSAPAESKAAQTFWCQIGPKISGSDVILVSNRDENIRFGRHFEVMWEAWRVHFQHYFHQGHPKGRFHKFTSILGPNSGSFWGVVSHTF